MKVEKLILCVGTGTIITIIENLFGHIDKSLCFLCLVMVLDFATGLMCGATNHELSSEVCTKGLFKKLFILIYVMVAHHLDNLLNVDYIRSAVCYMYATGEVLSIIENGVVLGVPIPTPIKKALEVLNSNNEGGEENED